ncbi:MAG TPA: hypothetical protein PLR83_00090 [Pyrinomonadaceae bacterium]|nr:hypothetical protein [Pyrinomonadaceae bacterium]
METKLDKDMTDEIRLLVLREITKAFGAASDAAQKNIVTPGHEADSKQDLVNQLKRAKDAITDLEREAEAVIVEKTDPARANVIRRLKPSF